MNSESASQARQPEPQPSAFTPPDSQAWTVQRILAWTTDHLRKHGSESARLESEILLAHARQCRRIELYAHFHDIVDEPTRKTMRELVKRRAQREPVAYLVGHRDFFSLEFLVQPGVFIPRPETELLVEKSLQALAQVPSPRLLELCTGSGCVAVTVAVKNENATVVAVEKNEIPLSVAAQNAKRHNVVDRVQIVAGDLFEPLINNLPLADEKFDVIVSNPPYVCSGEIAELVADVQTHEPHAALDGGPDGLHFVRQIIEQASDFLKPGGCCLIEMDPSQFEAAEHHVIEQDRYDQITRYRDLFEQERCLGFRKR